MSGLLNQIGVFFGFCREQIPGRGEDSWCYSLNDRAAIFGVLDGLGGSGAMGYREYGGHTGAYMASRTAAQSLIQWFDGLCSGVPCSIDSMADQILEDLQYCRSLTTQTSGLKGSIVRDFPTTVAAWLLRNKEDRITGYSISAGDSRNYILDAEGLGQISMDDLTGVDAMSNLYRDAPMTNVLSAEGGFRLHRMRFEPKGPTVFLSATDGCFGYLKSPMEFEHLLLETLMTSQSVDHWNKRLSEAIGEAAGDDYSLAVAAVGFRTFRELRGAMKKRYKAVCAQVAEFGDDLSAREAEWERCKAHYYRYAEGGIPASE